MQVERVIQTFKDGVLTSKKVVKVPPSTNPETGWDASPPKHHKALDLGDFSAVAIQQAANAQELLMAEVRKLRRNLIKSEREAGARLKERDALKKALQRRLDQVEGLQMRNDDLSCQVAAHEDDNLHLEEELTKYKNRVTFLSTQRATPPDSDRQRARTGPRQPAQPEKTQAAITKSSAEKAAELLGEPAQEQVSKEVRSIAASPVKK